MQYYSALIEPILVRIAEQKKDKLLVYKICSIIDLWKFTVVKLELRLSLSLSLSLSLVKTRPIELNYPTNFCVGSFCYEQKKYYFPIR